MGSECLVSPFAFEPTADQTSQLSAVPSSAGTALLKCPGMPSTGGSGVMMVNGGRLNTVASANLQVQSTSATSSNLCVFAFRMFGGVDRQEQSGKFFLGGAQRLCSEYLQ